MDIQRVRNITTPWIHTEIGHIHKDLEMLSGIDQLWTHDLLYVSRALLPFLANRLDERFFDGQHDGTHVGDVDIPPLSEAERKQLLDAIKAEEKGF